VAKQVALYDGSFTIVSDDDFELVSKFSWHLHGKGYVQGCIGGNAVLLHRFIMGAKGKEIVHHINGVKTDNRRENLKIVNINTNNHARNYFKKFPYIGVNKHPQRKTFTAEMRIKGKRKLLGYFNEPFDAALAYDAAVTKHYGDDAQTNLKFLQKLLALFLSRR
jgi:hypothetical protein